MSAGFRALAGQISFSKTGITLVKSGIAIAALWWLFSHNKLSAATLVSLVSSWWVLFLFITLCASLFFQGVRWWCLLRFNKVKLPLGRVLVFSWIGQFFQTVTPGTLGAEVSRFYYVTNAASGAKLQTINSVFLDRLLALASFFALALVVLVFVKPMFIEKDHVIFLACACVTSLLATTAFLFWVAWRHKQEFGSEASKKICKRLFFWVGIAFLFSFASAVSIAVSFQLGSLMVDRPLFFSTSAVTIPFVMVANGIPVTPGGIGIGEAVSMLTFAKSGYARGAEIMFIVRFCLIVVRLPGLYLFWCTDIIKSNQ